MSSLNYNPSTPYISVIARNDWGRSQNPWDEIHQSIPTLPKTLKYDPKKKHGVQLIKGIGVNAPINGAIVVLNSIEGWSDLYDLAVLMAYRRGCRRFLIVLARSEQVSDNPLLKYIAKEIKQDLNNRLKDAKFKVIYGSIAEKSKQDFPLRDTIIRTIDSWVSSATVVRPVESVSQTSDASVALIELLENLIHPVCGLIGYKKEIIQVNTKCSHHQQPLSEHFELDFRFHGHGLPFDSKWSLSCCKQAWIDGRKNKIWAHQGCYQVDKKTSLFTENQTNKVAISGYMLPSVELLESLDLKLLIKLKEAYNKFRSTVGPSSIELYQTTQQILGLEFPPGQWQLGGLMCGPTKDEVLQCPECNSLMPMIFNGGRWGDIQMFFWQCLKCKDQSCIGFQK